MQTTTSYDVAHSNSQPGTCFPTEDDNGNPHPRFAIRRPRPKTTPRPKTAPSRKTISPFTVGSPNLQFNFASGALSSIETENTDSQWQANWTADGTGPHSGGTGTGSGTGSTGGGGTGTGTGTDAGSRGINGGGTGTSTIKGTGPGGTGTGETDSGTGTTDTGTGTGSGGTGGGTGTTGSMMATPPHNESFRAGFLLQSILAVTRRFLRQSRAESFRGPMSQSYSSLDLEFDGLGIS